MLIKTRQDSLTCWSLHMGLTLLLLMPTGCPIGGRAPTLPDPPAIETVMLMLLYTPCWPKACTAPCPGWLNKLWHGNNKAKNILVVFGVP